MSLRPWPKPLKFITAGGYRSHPLFVDLNKAQPPSSVVKPSHQHHHHHHDGSDSQPLILSLSKPEPNTSHLSDLSLSLKPRTQLLDLLLRRAPNGAWNMNRCCVVEVKGFTDLPRTVAVVAREITCGGA
ncbi:hypothetical protein CMV_024445 [Castanea mollissima]|uniref:Uncharacterized protein n=1 Tax=Castanea mollissima TaxID=60419 RepID=A0A8J4QMS1_9ROSI|nr:hypothetical protein CMV_024445 [Castanea mollissima]